MGLSQPPERDRSQAGSAVVIALLMMTLLMLLSGAILSTSLTDSAIASNQISVTRAFHLAEAGIEHARVELAGRDLPALLRGGGVLFADYSLGNGAYTVTVANNLAPLFPRAGIPAETGPDDENRDGYLILTSTGAFHDATRSIEVIVKAEVQPWNVSGVFGEQYVSASGRGSIHGDVSTNSNIYLRSYVFGNASAVGTIDFPHRVSGDVITGTAVARQRFRALPCPDTGWVVPSGHGVNFDATSGNLTISGSSDTFLPSGTYFFNKLTKSGTGKIVVGPGSMVEIYLKDSLTISGNGFDNTNPGSDNLRLLGCGDNPGMLMAAGEFSLGTDHDMSMIVYAPSHRLRIYGDGMKSGSFIGKSIFKAGNGDLFHDPAIASGSDTTYAVVSGTWRDLSLR